MSTAVSNGVSFFPRQMTLAPSETCTLRVMIDSVSDSLACIECWVSFDTTLVTLIHAEEGALFEGFQGTRLFFRQQIAPGVESVEGCVMGYRSYVLTPGEMVRYVFQATGNGVCPVRIVNLRLWDIDRELFEPVVDPNAWIIVGTPTGVETPELKTGYLRCYPNPFNPCAKLVLSLPTPDGELF
jgi:hypothetical protein